MGNLWGCAHGQIASELLIRIAGETLALHLFHKMASMSSELPLGYTVRRLQLNDRDRLAFYLMPHNPQPVLAFIPRKWMLILCKVGHGIVLTVIPGSALYVVILFFIGLSSRIDWSAIVLGWLALVGVCVGFALGRSDEDWLKRCWVVEQEGRFVAYGVLRSYSDYSHLELLQVHPKWARKGLGSALVRTMLQQTPKPVYVESAIRVVGFYDRLGFRKIRFKELPPKVQQRFQLRGVATLMVYE